MRPVFGALMLLVVFFSGIRYTFQFSQTDTKDGVAFKDSSSKHVSTTKEKTLTSIGQKMFAAVRFAQGISSHEEHARDNTQQQALKRSISMDTDSSQRQITELGSVANKADIFGEDLAGMDSAGNEVAELMALVTKTNELAALLSQSRAASLNGVASQKNIGDIGAGDIFVGPSFEELKVPDARDMAACPMPKAGNKYFHLHMRKAGGSTVRKILKKAGSLSVNEYQPLDLADLGTFFCFACFTEPKGIIL